MIKRIAINLAHHLLVMWWFLTRPQSSGVKVLVAHENKFLLVRPTYSHKLWTIPGGGIKKGESPERAGVREIYEELGIQLENITWFGSYESNFEYKKVKVDCYSANVGSVDFMIDDFEIGEAQWFRENDFPLSRVSSVDKIMALYEAR